MASDFRAETAETSRFSQVVELERQRSPPRLLLVTFEQQTEELRLKDALEDAVILLLVDYEQVVLQGAADRREDGDLSLVGFRTLVPLVQVHFC